MNIKHSMYRISKYRSLIQGILYGNHIQYSIKHKENVQHLLDTIVLWFLVIAYMPRMPFGPPSWSCDTDKRKCSDNIYWHTTRRCKALFGLDRIIEEQAWLLKGCGLAEWFEKDSWMVQRKTWEEARNLHHVEKRDSHELRYHRSLRLYRTATS